MKLEAKASDEASSKEIRSFGSADAAGSGPGFSCLDECWPTDASAEDADSGVMVVLRAPIINKSINVIPVGVEMAFGDGGIAVELN
jgi:hypothetical protein